MGLSATLQERFITADVLVSCNDQLAIFCLTSWECCLLALSRARQIFGRLKCTHPWSQVLELLSDSLHQHSFVLFSLPYIVSWTGRSWQICLMCLPMAISGGLFFNDLFELYLTYVAHLLSSCMMCNLAERAQCCHQGTPSVMQRWLAKNLVQRMKHPGPGS